jgi:diphthine synthase
MLYIIGLGLSDVQDITLKGLNAIKSSEFVYLEAYTSILGVNINELEKFYEKKLIIADREMVEQKADEMLEQASSKNVSFLVVGDPLGATTHTDLILRAIEKQIPYKLIHNASIMNAVGCCGLQLYNFGETVSLCFWTDTWKPISFFNKICSNRKLGMHTLCLLDIKVKEKTIENLIKNRNIYEPPRYMTVSDACQQLCEIIESTPNRADDSPTEELVVQQNIIFNTTLCVGLARIGSETQKIAVDTISALKESDFGAPLHSLVIIGRLHPLEAEFLKGFYRNENSSFSEKVEIHNKFYSKN